MVEIPADVVTMEHLAQWYKMKKQLAELRFAESTLRKRIFGNFFPAPIEGTNNFQLADGYVLKAVYSIDRDVDVASLAALTDKFTEAGLRTDSLIRKKPELVLREYRTLTAEQQALFDQCLVIKPGSPQLDIVKPAKGK